MLYMPFLVQIPTFTVFNCKSGRLGIYFVKYGHCGRHAAWFDIATRFQNILRFIMGHWGSVHQGPNKNNKNRWLAAHSRVFEIDQEVNSIHVNRQASQVRPFMPFGCAVNQTGEAGSDLRVRRGGTRTLHADELTGISDGH